MKYRLWDKQDKKMVYLEDVKDSKDVLAIGLHGLPIAVDQDSFRSGVVVSWNVDHRYVPMECTGKKNDYGREVYVGDAIKLTGRLHGSLEEEICIVYYDEEKACFGPFSHVIDEENRWMDIDYKIELIGNIYERPELRPQTITANDVGLFNVDAPKSSVNWGDTVNARPTISDVKEREP